MGNFFKKKIKIVNDPFQIISQWNQQKSLDDFNGNWTNLFPKILQVFYMCCFTTWSLQAGSYDFVSANLFQRFCQCYLVSAKKKLHRKNNAGVRLREKVWTSDIVVTL